MRRVQRISQVVKQYDSRLFAEVGPNGLVQVMRQPDKYTDEDYEAMRNPSLLNSNLLFVLTDNWTVTGKPVDWGIEPIMAKLKRMDAWNRDIYSQIVENREREEYYKNQSQKNEFRAIAADARRSFAKATNDINTSTLAKTSVREMRGK